MGLFSNIFGGKASGGDKERGLALAEFLKLKAPNAEDLTYQLDEMVQQGLLQPEQAQAILQDPSALESMNLDPGAMNAQLEALNQLQDISRNGGMTDVDKARLANIQSQMGAQERGSREAIMMNARERGVAGGGAELAAQFANQQASADRANLEGLNVNAQAQQAALEAIKASGAMGGQIRGQQFGEASTVASAKDAINRFNTANRQDVVNANTAARNAAAAQNLSEKQRVADSNVGLRNQEREIGANARQQGYDNALNKASGIAGQYQNIANAADERRKQRQAFTGGVIGAAGQAASGALAKSDEREKENIEDVDLDDFMGSLKPKSFEYKEPDSPGATDGTTVGVMAQDVEKTPVGRTMVKETKDGKMLDMQKGFSVVLAALAALHDKLEKERS